MANTDERKTHMTERNTQDNPAMPDGTRIVIDEDCPSCEWPERWLDPNKNVFGCNKCTYRSQTRHA